MAGALPAEEAGRFRTGPFFATGSGFVGTDFGFGSFGFASAFGLAFGFGTALP